MRETRLSGSEGGAEQTNAPFLPLYIDPQCAGTRGQEPGASGSRVVPSERGAPVRQAQGIREAPLLRIGPPPDSSPFPCGVRNFGSALGREPRLAPVRRMPRPEARSRRSEVGCRRTEVGGQKSAFSASPREPGSESSVGRSEAGSRRAADGGQGWRPTQSCQRGVRSSYRPLFPSLPSVQCRSFALDFGLKPDVVRDSPRALLRFGEPGAPG